ncbi:MAG TPA: biotin/lipoyl-binding protein [Spirochaetia bacterium]|nr:biotin/lipoyl-binding protein [Spirochaetales bacterium]HRY80234.1 biotin/lipoyl-binding protein [Spirochaetia bacterium]HRZ90190.1 biotin/lipoyl-binding protein [Spirochaetia bacterium]
MKSYKIYVNGQAFDVSVEEVGGSAPAAPAPAAASAPAPRPAPAAPAASPAPAAGASSVKAPMPGTILGVKVAPGQAVKKGQVLLILEAMKMENEICAGGDGTVAAVRVQAGQSVNTGDPLVDMA